MNAISRCPSWLLLPVVAFVLAAAGVLAGCTDAPTPPPSAAEIPFAKQGELIFIQEGTDLVTIDIEIADTDSLRARGLMERRSLPELGGMLFVFEQAGPQQFYMANTPLSLDFFFVGADSVIVNTVKAATPLSIDPVVSVGPALLVVEVEAGFIDTWGIVAGDRVSWRRTDAQ